MPTFQLRSAVIGIAFLALHLKAAEAAHDSPRFLTAIPESASGNPFAIDFNATTNRVYVAAENYPSLSSLLVIDGATDTLVATVGLPGRTLGLEVDEAGNRVFVTDIFQDKVHVVSGATNAVVGTLTVAAPRGAGIDTVGGQLFVTEGASPWTPATIAVFSLATLARVATIPVGPDPFGIAVDNVRGRVYVSLASPSNLTIIDPSTLTVTASVPVDTNARFIKVDETSGLVYIEHGNQPFVTVFDGPGAAVLTSLPFSGGAIGIGLNPAASRLYVSVSEFGGGSVHAFDTNTHTKVGEVPLPFGKFTSDLVVDPLSDQVYAAANASVLVIGDRANAGPTANAGSNQFAGELEEVTLSGSGSDPDGDPLRFTWSQTAGPAVLTTSRTPYGARVFTTPDVTTTTDLVFELVVDDGLLSSAPDTVVVTVVEPRPNVGAGNTACAHGQAGARADPRTDAIDCP